MSPTFQFLVYVALGVAVYDAVKFIVGLIIKELRRK